MFKDLTPQDILSAIESLENKGGSRSTDYGLWYHGKTYSPAGVISKAIMLKGNPIDHRTFTTDVAQKTLLKLGFPIVEVDHDFFSAKELNSFIVLTARPIYDSSNTVDINIGDFLNQVIWEKSKRWALGLKELGWEYEGAKNWNERDIKGQRFKKYTWFKIYPKSLRHPLLFFTIGVDMDGSLLYKLDIKSEDEFFVEKKSLFYKERDKRGAGWQQFSIDQVKNENWDSLIAKSHRFFEDNLIHYKFFLDYFWGEKRIMRLTWNTNNWELPISHTWKPADQGKPNVAHEHQYGYGHEEWLFNPRYRKGDFQYGYIRGVDHMSQTVESISKLILFTINPIDKKRYLIGKLVNVEIIEGYEEEIKLFKPVYDKYFEDMVRELKIIGADYQYFKKSGLFPNVKFKWADAEIYNDAILSDTLNSDKYKRFQPYILDEDLEKVLEGDLTTKNKLVFKAGIAANASFYNKTTTAGTTHVNRYHSNITNDLNKFLNEVKGYNNDQISIELTKVGGAIVDAAVKIDQTLILFEIKTSSTGLGNIRQALGQIFEYALLDDKVNISHLYIVGPAALKKLEQDYWDRLKEIIKIPMTYLEYDNQAQALKDKFKEY